MYRMFVNILVTAVLLVFTSWSGLYALCAYDPVFNFCRLEDRYLIIGAISLCIMTGSMFLSQYLKVKSQYLAARRKPDPLPVTRTSKFNSAVKFLWAGSLVEEKEDDSCLVDFGWEVHLANGDYVQVTEREFFHWLAGVVRSQVDMQISGELAISSPLSQRKHVPNLGRTKWRVYRVLLAEANALVKVNGNVVALKDSVLQDPWQVVKAIEAIRPLKEL